MGTTVINNNADNSNNTTNTNVGSSTIGTSNTTLVKETSMIL